MWLCSFHVVSFFESPGKRRLIGRCLFVVRIHKTRWKPVALCSLLWAKARTRAWLGLFTHDPPREGGRWWSAVLSRTREVRRTEDCSHSHSALPLGVSSLPSISFWPNSQFPFPFLTAQAKLPEEERWVSNAKQNLFEPSSGEFPDFHEEGEELLGQETFLWQARRILLSCGLLGQHTCLCRNSSNFPWLSN